MCPHMPQTHEARPCSHTRGRPEKSLRAGGLDAHLLFRQRDFLLRKAEAYVNPGPVHTVPSPESEAGTPWTRRHDNNLSPGSRLQHQPNTPYQTCKFNTNSMHYLFSASFMPGTTFGPRVQGRARCPHTHLVFTRDQIRKWKGMTASLSLLGLLISRVPWRLLRASSRPNGYLPTNSSLLFFLKKINLKIQFWLSQIMAL